MKTLKEYYEELDLKNGNKNLDKLSLYSLCKNNIQDTDFEDSFITTLYNFWEYINEEYYMQEYEIQDFVHYLEDKTTELNIDLRDINLDKLLEEFKDEE